MTARPAMRSRLLGVGLGVLLLLALVMLAVVLPRLEDGAAPDAASASEQATGEAVEVDLPASVDGFTVPQTDDAAAAEELDARLGSAETRLEEIYGVPVSIEFYTDRGSQDGSRTAAVTALSTSAGLFLPTGPAPDPELLNLARNQAELVRIGEDAVCNLNYGAPVPVGETVDAEAVPPGVQCQLTRQGVTYQVDGSAMSAEKAVGLLEAIATDPDADPVEP